MIRTQIYLTEEEKRGLAALADRTGRNQSELIREAVDRYLRRFRSDERAANYLERRDGGLHVSAVSVAELFVGARADEERHLEAFLEAFSVRPVTPRLYASSTTLPAGRKTRAARTRSGGIPRRSATARR